MLRNLFLSNPVLYQFWFKYFRNAKTTLPARGDAMFFTGYQRSGNSYFTNLFKELYPGLKFTHHLHTIAAIKIALKNNVPVLVIVREPIESISSLYVMNNQQDGYNREVLEKCIADYNRYHQFLKDNIAKFRIINFDESIRKPSLFLDAVAKLGGKAVITKEDYGRMEQIVDEKIIEKKQSKMSDSHRVKFSSTPNEARNERKAIIKGYLQDNKNVATSNSLYEYILKHGK